MTASESFTVNSCTAPSTWLAAVPKLPACNTNRFAGPPISTVPSVPSPRMSPPASSVIRAPLPTLMASPTRSICPPAVTLTSPATAWMSYVLPAVPNVTFLPAATASEASTLAV